MTDGKYVGAHIERGEGLLTAIETDPRPNTEIIRTALQREFLDGKRQKLNELKKQLTQKRAARSKLQDDRDAVDEDIEQYTREITALQREIEARRDS